MQNIVGADSLMVSVLTYSTTVLTATRVWFPSRGPLPIPLLSLHPILSCLLSPVLSNKKPPPQKKKNIGWISAVLLDGTTFINTFWY